MAAKPKSRCSNCGDPTHFNVAAAGPREQRGWCRPCWTQAMRLEKSGPGTGGNMGWIPQRPDYKDDR